MSTVRRKRATRDSKGTAKYPRKSVKVAPRAAAPKKRTPGNFALLRAAHRGRMGAVLASATADRLREIAQVVGLTHDTNAHGRHLPAPVLRAMHDADTSLLAQISALEEFASSATDGPTSVGDAIERAVSWCAHASGRGEVKFVNDVPRRLPAVQIDATDLQEILFALLMNAREATRQRRAVEIQIKATERDNMVLLLVEDDGPGLPAALRKRLFGATTGAATPRDSHLGIGLAVARQLARDHGGELQYDGRGKGARFVLAMRAWRSGRVGGVRRAL